MTTSSRRTPPLLAVAALVAAALLPACYTLMQHPRLASLSYARPDDKHCLNCHAEPELRQLVIGQQRSGSRDPWSTYYDEPWWFASYLRSDSATTDNKESEATTGNGKDGR